MKMNYFVKSVIAMLLFAVCGTVDAQAQGYLNDATTGNAISTRDPARQASTEIDAVITNPAGVMFLKNGFHASVSGIFSYRDISSHLNVVEGGTYSCSDTRVLPAIQFAYKKDKWAISASFSSEGGFGLRKIKNARNELDTYLNLISDGMLNELNNSFSENNMGVLLLAILSDLPTPDINREDKYSFFSDNITQPLYNWRIQLGGNYKITDNFSAYIGVKANHVVSKNLPCDIKIVRPSTGEIWNIEDYYQNWLDVIDNVNVGEIDKNKFHENIESLVNGANNITRIINNNNSGWGFAPIIGLDYKIDKFNFGVKYEFESRVNVKNSKSHYNIPSILSVGADWKISNKVKVAVGSNILFGTDNYAFSDSSTSSVFDISASCTYNINKKFLLSGGYTYGRVQKICPDITSVLINPHSNNRISLGVAYSPVEDIQINLGVSSDVNKMECNTFINNLFYANYLYYPMIQAALGVSYHF